ncbi:hypothetical protein A9X00_26435 [Mycobacterium sp. 1245805.9]|nr:hypothetical protein A9X00_26435 [Mycobacterium sp. 1245805.9]
MNLFHTADNLRLTGIAVAVAGGDLVLTQVVGDAAQSDWIVQAASPLLIPNGMRGIRAARHYDQQITQIITRGYLADLNAVEQWADPAPENADNALGGASRNIEWSRLRGSAGAVFPDPDDNDAADRVREGGHVLREFKAFVSRVVSFLPVEVKVLALVAINRGLDHR